MSLSRTAILLATPLPFAAKAAVTQTCCRVFSDAFGVEAPDILEWALRAKANDFDPAGDGRPDLWAFREFSAACLKTALGDAVYAKSCRENLYAEARKLGEQVRIALSPRKDEVDNLITFVYKLIHIEVASTPDEIVFESCSFAKCYTARTCALMSAFDSGFVAGVRGCKGLEFTERITEGAPCCRALVCREERA